MTGPPVQFGVIGGIVEPQRFGESGRPRQFWAPLLVYHIEMNCPSIDGVAQQRFEGRPVPRCGERKSVGATVPNCVGSVAMLIGDAAHRAEIEGCEMIGIV